MNLNLPLYIQAPLSLRATGKDQGKYFPPMNASIKQTLEKQTKTTPKILRLQKVPLPKKFSWKSGPLVPVFNQRLCGSCWAVAATTMIADRFSLYANEPIPLDPTLLLSCDRGQNQGCCGGNLQPALLYIEEMGIGYKDCVNYNWCAKNDHCSGDPKKHFDAPYSCGKMNELTPGCYDSLDCIPKLYIKKPMSIFAQSLQEIPEVYTRIKEELRAHGPVATTYVVWMDFMFPDLWKKTKGIYINGSYDSEFIQKYGELSNCKDTSPSECMAGRHAVVIVGWGEERVNGKLIPYWEVKNSWGKSWNKDGYFKIAMYYPDNSDIIYEPNLNDKCDFVHGTYTNSGNLSGQGISICEPLTSKSDIKPKPKHSKYDKMSSYFKRYKRYIIQLIILFVLLFLFLFFF